MMVKRKKTVIAAICMAVASVGFVAEVNASAPPQETQETQETSAPDLQNFHLAEIVVNGKRYIAGEYVRATSNIGILGEQDAMNSPISVTTISEKAVEDFMSSTEGLSKMLSLVPSVQKTYDAAVDCVNIRGFSESGRGFMVNGIPGMQAMTRQSSN